MNLDLSTCVICDHANVIHHPVLVAPPGMKIADFANVHPAILPDVIAASSFTECGEADCFCRFVDNDKELIFYV